MSSARSCVAPSLRETVIDMGTNCLIVFDARLADDAGSENLASERKCEVSAPGWSGDLDLRTGLH